MIPPTLASNRGVLPLLDDLAAFETPAMAWLRRVAPVATRLNKEAEMELIREGKMP